MASRNSLFGGIIRIFADLAAGLAAFGVLVVVLIQVASRMLGSPIPWTEEATRYLFVWMVFLGIAAGFRKVESARITIFLAVLPAFVRRAATPIYVVACVLFFSIMGWTGYGLVRQQFMMNETAATLVMPMWMIGIIMPLSATLAILAVVHSLRTRRDLIDVSAKGLPLDGMPESNVFANAERPR